MAAYRMHFFSKVGDEFKPTVKFNNPSSGFGGEVAEFQIGEFSFPLTRAMADDLIHQAKCLEVDLMERDKAKIKAFTRANGHDLEELEGKDAMAADL